MRVFILLQLTVGVVVILMPYNTSVSVLNVYFFIIGFCYGVFQISSRQYICKLQTKNASVWMSYYLLCWCSAGVATAIVEICDVSVDNEYIIAAAITFASVVILLITPSPESDEQLVEFMRENAVQHAATDHIPHYYVDLLCASMLEVAFNMGAKESIIYYVETYITETSITDRSTLVYLLLVVNLAIGYVIFIQTQRNITDDTIMIYAYIAFIIQLIPLLTICIKPGSEFTFIYSIAVYGLISAPSISLCFELCYRYTYRSSASTMIMFVGLDVGAMVIPYITTAV
jgi:hypothetical protein